MQEEKNGLIQKLTTNKKSLTFIIILGILGIVLIGISEIFSKPSSTKKPKETNDNQTVSFVQQDYIDVLEQKVLDIVGSIDGVGKAKVMISLDSTYEYIYAKTQESSTDIADSQDNTQKSSHQTKKEEYVYIEDENGRKQALLISQVLPKIKGVVVVCEGGDTLAVRNNVINAVTTVLGVYSNNVYVTKLSTN